MENNTNMRRELIDEMSRKIEEQIATEIMTNNTPIFTSTKAEWERKLDSEVAAMKLEFGVEKVEYVSSPLIEKGKFYIMKPMEYPFCHDKVIRVIYNPADFYHTDDGLFKR